MHLRASMPPLRAVRGMESRIARKVAALTGIAGSPGDSDDAGRGRSWFSDHRRLTVVELRLGGPLSDGADSGLFRRGDGGFVFADGEPGTGAAPLPNATLRQYGPDTKAALVLTGANHILEPITRAVRAGLEDVRAQIDDECLLAAVAHALLQEAFEAQPVLFLHGIQAGLVQRALALSSVVDDHRDGEEPLARLEFGHHRNDAPQVAPMRLGVVHGVWTDVVTPDGDPAPAGCSLSFGADAGYEQDRTFAIADDPDRRDEWTTTLCDLSEHLLVGGGHRGPRGIVRISHTESVSRATAALPRERQIETLLARLAPRMRADTGPDRAVVLPTLDAVRWAQAGVLDRRAVLLAHYYAVRAAGWLAGMQALHRLRDRATTARRYTELAAAAERLLAADDPLRLQLTAHCRAYALQYHACRGELNHDAYRRVVDDLDRLVEATDAGRCSPATLLEQLHLVLVALGTYWYATTWYVAHRGGGTIDGDDLRRLWPVALRLRDELVGDGPDGVDLDHSYAGHLVSDPTRPDEVLAGIRLLTDTVIPARRDGPDGRRRGLRLSLQALAYALASALDHGLGDGGQAAGWAEQAHAVADELSVDERLGAALSRDDAEPDNALVVLLHRIAAARVAATTAPGCTADPARVAQTGAAVRQMVSYTGGRRPGGTPTVDNLRIRQVAELEQHWAAWFRSSRADR